MRATDREQRILDVATKELWRRIELAGPLDEAPRAFEESFVFPDDSSERDAAQYGRRRSFIALYGWAVPTREAIQAIAAFVDSRSVLEICAGAGLWGRLLAEAGVEVLATDAAPLSQTYVPVEALDAEAAVRSHPERDALLMCWPPFRSDCAFRALTAFGGDRLAYVGDVRFTGDAQLHDLLASQWRLESRLMIPAWPGLDDYVYLYSRR